MEDDGERQARELFHNSMRTSKIDPEWHSLFDTGGSSGKSGATYASLTASDAYPLIEGNEVVAPSYSEAELAGAKLARGLMQFEHVQIQIESNSVYGPAVLMPQLARSTGWNCHLTSLTISSFLYLLLCMGVHGGMLMFMAKEERVMDGFAGQMYLCDFGENIDRCNDPNGTECIGPGGTNMSGARLYSWTQWTVRTYVKDSLTQLFPALGDKIDPGEYGVESYNCRLVCVILFIISIIPELELCVDLARLLWYVPSRGDPWITLLSEEEAKERETNLPRLVTPDLKEVERPQDTEAETADEALKQVRVAVAGMPIGWKVFNLVFVCLPKFVLTLQTAQTGMVFLMETAGIDDIIVNSVALGFLLSLDELLTDNLMSKGANELIDMCEGYTMASSEDAGTGLTNDETVRKYADFRCWRYCKTLFYDLVGWQLIKFLSAAVLTTYYVLDYYTEHCDWKDGRFVSKTIYLPKTTAFTYLNALLPHYFPVEKEAEPWWIMPERPRNIPG